MKRFFKFGCLGFLLLFIISLVISIIYAVNNADELGTTPSGKIAKSLDISPEKAQETIEVLGTVGIEEDADIIHDELLDGAHDEGEKGYRINTSKASNVILYISKDETVNLIKYADNILYENNTVVANLGDFTLTNEEKSQLQYNCQEAIKSILKSPSTAKFPNILEWKFGKQDGVTIVQGYVDSQNGFGAMIRSDFQFKIQDNNVISLIFEGKEHIQ